MSDNVVSKINNQAESIQYFHITGLRYSAFESALEDTLFSTPTAPVNANSAVTVLNIAVTNNQPILQIDNSNALAAISSLNLDSDVVTELTDAIADGKQVTVPQNNISANGWTGTGYIIFDPDSGSGAYEISGHTNGSVAILDKTFDTDSIIADYLGDVSSASYGFTALGFATGLAGIAIACANNATAMYNVMMGYMFMSLLFVLLGAIFAPTGLGLIAMDVAFDGVQGAILKFAEKQNGCTNGS